MSFGRRLLEARKAKGFTQEQLATAIGVAKSTVTGYEKGNREPDVSKIKALSQLLDVPGGYLLGIDENGSNESTPSPQGIRIGRAYDKADPPVKRTVDVALEPYMDNGSTKKAPPVTEDAEASEELCPDVELRDIPLFLLPAAAGSGVFLDGDAYDVVQVGSEVPLSASFGVRISGDSMEPKYPDGGIAWVRMTPSIDEGRVGVFVLNGSGYIKKLGRGELISLNPGYDPIPLGEHDEFRTCGLVVGVTEL